MYHKAQKKCYLAFFLAVLHKIHHDNHRQKQIYLRRRATVVDYQARLGVRGSSEGQKSQVVRTVFLFIILLYQHNGKCNELRVGKVCRSKTYMPTS